RINCAAIPPERFDAELFGEPADMTTGASGVAAGRLALADGGTLFFANVGDMPITIQHMLLRVLEQGELHRTGEDVTRPVGVRLICTSSHDLRADVRRGRFDDALYFRLAIVPIETMPLRERRDDIPLLAAHFVRRESG